MVSSLPRLLCALALLAFLAVSSTAATMMQNIEITGGKPTIRNGGNVVDLRLEQSSASGFQSKQEYLFARVDMQIKLPAGDSAGTVTTFYMSSQGNTHDEIDLEFLGNETGKPYVLHTNVYAQGNGKKEMQFYLWFDPTAAYHTYSILWNPQHIIFYVDRRPIRVFTNKQAVGVPFPTSQPMRVYASIWNADDWATQGGRVKTNWANAPFIASYSNFRAIPCPSSSKLPLCGQQPSTPVSATSSSGVGNGQGLKQVPTVDDWTRKMTLLLQRKYMIYNYCADVNRFAQGLPPECSN
ncbi:putative xyloglucan endotransglucosylase/hydrolase protein 21 [Nymphaea thermarum]|nr:putative xyloglucan endotransglucosylase/hydrolase protein 21 [Nymphaea thermarum]